jgi:hypothetical protein
MTAGDTKQVTATATSDPTLTGTVPVQVAAGAASVFVLGGVTGPITAGVPITVTVAADDQFGNVATGYSGTVHFTSTDGAATLPADAALPGGTGSFPVTFHTAGSQTLTATDTANGGLTGSLSGVTVVLPPPPPNTPPSISTIADTTIRLNQSSGPLGFTIGDDFTPVNSLALTVTSSDGTLLPLAGLVFGGSGANRTLTVTPAAGHTGVGTVTVTVRDGGGLTSSDTFNVTVNPGAQPPSLIGTQQFTAGTDTGGSPTVRLFNPDGTERTSLNVFDPSFTGGVRTAAADFNGDGVADIVVGTGPGTATLVRILDGVTGNELFSINPFETTFTGGVYVAAGDLTGKGYPDLVITPDQGGGPRVRVFDGKTFAQVADFFGIDDPNFRGGARAAVGDIAGKGYGDLIVAAGFQGGPRVAGFDGKSVVAGSPQRIFGDFFAFEQTLRNGVFVAAGDINGDGHADLVVGGGPGGGPRVTVFDGAALLGNQQVMLANFFGGDPTNRGGIRVAVKDLDGDNRADLLVGSGENAGTQVTAYYGKNIGPSGTPPVAFDFDAFTQYNGGVFVG